MTPCCANKIFPLNISIPPDLSENPPLQPAAASRAPGGAPRPPHALRVLSEVQTADGKLGHVTAVNGTSEPKHMNFWVTLGMLLLRHTATVTRFPSPNTRFSSFVHIYILLLVHIALHSISPQRHDFFLIFYAFFMVCRHADDGTIDVDLPGLPSRTRIAPSEVTLVSAGLQPAGVLSGSGVTLELQHSRNDAMREHDEEYDDDDDFSRWTPRSSVSWMSFP